MANEKHLGFDWDPEEVTGVDHVRVDEDPLVNQGQMMAAIVRLQKQVKEGFGHVRALDGRLKRIERLLYGACGSAALGIIQYILQRLGIHGP